MRRRKQKRVLLTVAIAVSALIAFIIIVAILWAAFSLIAGH